MLFQGFMLLFNTWCELGRSDWTPPCPCVTHAIFNLHHVSFKSILTTEEWRVKSLSPPLAAWLRHLKASIFSCPNIRRPWKQSRRRHLTTEIPDLRDARSPVGPLTTTLEVDVHPKTKQRSSQCFPNPLQATLLWIYCTSETLQVVES